MKDKHQYHHLTRKEIAHPIRFIKFFCRSETGLNEFRQEILDMIKSACSPDKFGDREVYFYNYRCLLKLLDIAHILYKRQQSFSLTGNSFSLTRIHNERFTAYYEQLIKTDFRTLSVEERGDVKLFFNSFFSFQTLKEWQMTFSRFVEYAYRRDTIDEVFDEGSIMILLMEYTEKFLEAIYLIYHTQSVTYVDFSGTMQD